MLEGGSSASAARNAVRDGIAGGDRPQLIEVGEARFGAIVLLLEHGVVDRADGRDVARDARAALLALRDARDAAQLSQERGERSVGLPRARRRDEVREGVRIPRALLHGGHQRARRGVADPRHQHEDAVPAHLVPRIVGHPQEREDVLHVRRLEELQPAPLLERDLAVGELDLEIGRHVAGAEQHRHLAERHAALVQLQHAVDDEAGLLRLVLRRHEPGLLAALARRPQILGEPLLGARDQRVGEVEDRRAWSGSSGRA